MQLSQARLSTLSSTPVDAAHQWVITGLEVSAEPAMSEAPPARDAFPEVSSAAARLGLRYVGRYRERVGARCHQQSAWLDPQRRAFVLGRGVKWGPILSLLSRYCIFSFFEDGTCLETHARRQPPMKSGARLFERVGCGELSADFEAHLAAAREHARARGTTALPVRSLEDVVFLMRAYYERIISPELADAIRPAPLRRTLSVIIMLVALVRLIVSVIHWLR